MMRSLANGSGEIGEIYRSRKNFCFLFCCQDAANLLGCRYPERNKEEIEIIYILLKNKAALPVGIGSLSPLAIAGATVYGEKHRLAVEVKDEFVLTASPCGEGDVEIVLKTMKSRKGIGRKGAEFSFHITSDPAGSGSFLRLRQRSSIVFMEYIYDCFRWLLIGLAYEVRSDGGVAEKLVADEIRKCLVTRHEFKAAKPKAKAEM